MDKFMQQIEARTPLSPDQRTEIVRNVMSLTSNLDREYLNAVYFPEISDACRVPRKFGQPTATFTRRQNFYLDSGSSGAGALIVAPQDITYKCAMTQSTQLATDGNLQQELNFIGEDDSDISTYFAETCLVGCSVNIEYIGREDEESGFLVASHVFGSTALGVSEDRIEEGYFTKRYQPKQGCRMVYLPKDDNDLNLFPSNVKIEKTGSNEKVVPRAWYGYDPSAIVNNNGNDYISIADDEDKGDQPLGQEGESGVTGPTTTYKVQSRVLRETVASAGGTKTIGWKDTELTNPPSYYWGQHANKGESQAPQLMCMYWRGLQGNVDGCFRVDIIRHFEGIPRQHIKDLVSVKRPKHSRRTVEHVAHNSHNTHLHNMSVEHGHRMKRYVSPIPEVIVDMPSLTEEPKESGGFLDTLKNIGGYLADAGLSTLGTFIGGELGGPQGAEIGMSLGSIAGSQVKKAIGGNSYGNDEYSATMPPPYSRGRQPRVGGMQERSASNVSMM